MTRSTLLLLGILVSIPLAAETSKEKAFWTWFHANAKRFYHRESAGDPAAIDGEINAEIRKVNPVLTGLIDGIREDGRRIFIIGCGGVKAGIPAVRALYRAMPYMNSFRVVEFVPGRIRMRAREYGGLGADPVSTRFLLFRDAIDGQVKVQMLFPGWDPSRESDYTALAKLFLIDAIGEWETMTKVRTIVTGSTDLPYAREAWPVQALPTRFNIFWYGVRIPGR